MAHGSIIELDAQKLSIKLLDAAITNPNLLTANESSAETDTTGLTAVSSTLTASNTYSKFGSNSFKAVCSNAAAAEGFSVDATVVGTAVATTFSVWLRGAVGGEVVRLNIYETTAADAAVRTHYGQPITLTTTFTRYFLPVQYSATGNKATPGVWTVTQGSSTFYADGLQLEVGAAPTVWTIGAGTTVTSPWVEVPARYNIRSFVSSALEEGVADATVDIHVSNDTTAPEDTTAGVITQTLNTTTTGATKVEAYRWVKAVKTIGTTPVATTVIMEAARQS